jgi:hypothetical protein
MILFTMDYRNGIYHWARSCVAYLPRDQKDSGLIVPCLRLLMSLEVHSTHFKLVRFGADMKCYDMTFSLSFPLFK